MLLLRAAAHFLKRDLLRGKPYLGLVFETDLHITEDSKGLPGMYPA